MNSSTESAISAVQRGFEAVGAAIAVLDAEGDGGRVDAGRPAAGRLLGRGGGGPTGRGHAGVCRGCGEGIGVRASSAVPRAAGPVLRHVRHRDGRRLEASLRVSPLSGQDGRAHWLVSATDMAAVPSWAANGLGPESLLAPAHRSVIGVVRDLQLRCTWVNDTHGTPGRHPPRRAAGTPAGGGGCPAEIREAEACEGVMRQVLNSGTPVVDHPYRAWPPADRAPGTRVLGLLLPSRRRGRPRAGRVRHERGRHRQATGARASGDPRRGQHAHRQHPGRHADRAGTGRPRRAAPRGLRHRRPGGVGPARRGAPGPAGADGRAHPRLPPRGPGIDPPGSAGGAVRAGGGGLRPAGLALHPRPVLREVPPGTDPGTPPPAPGSTRTRHGRRRSTRTGCTPG